MLGRQNPIIHYPVLRCLILLLWVNNSQAQDVPLSPYLYYEIGGGASYHRPLAEQTFGPQLQIEARLAGNPFSCEFWDQKHLNSPESWKDLIEANLRYTADALGATIVTQLQNLGTGIAVAALQRALPGMYDFSQNANAMIRAKVNIAKRECQDVVDDVHAGVNPIEAWRRASIGVDWRLGMSSGEFTLSGTDPSLETATLSAMGSSNVLSTKNAIQKRIESPGPLPWFGGEDRGDAGNPILLVEDMTTAGYAIQQGHAAVGAPSEAAGVTKSVRVLGEATEDREIRLGELWPDSEAAVVWSVKLLGEREIYTCSTEACASQFRPGVGLGALIAEERETLVSAWDALFALIEGGTWPTPVQLNSVSSGEVVVSVHVIEALINFAEQDQSLYIGRLISDVALSRAVEKAFALRKMLHSASETPVIAGYTPATREADKLIQRIRDEIDDTLWGLETQKKLTSNVSASILNYDTLISGNEGRYYGGATRKNSSRVFLPSPVE